MIKPLLRRSQISNLLPAPSATEVSLFGSFKANVTAGTLILSLFCLFSTSGNGDGAMSQHGGGTGGLEDGMDCDPTIVTADGSDRPRKRAKKVDENKREERNAREKERSFRISRQINELRNLLSNGGVIVPKGTKSSVLTEAANYIRMLQQHQYRSEIDRHQLVQQMQQIGGGALGQEAASAVRHVAAQNGVWSLGNFGGVPPKSALVSAFPPAASPEPAESTSPGGPLSNKIEDPEYRFVFNSCSVGMVSPEIDNIGIHIIKCALESLSHANLS